MQRFWKQPVKVDITAGQFARCPALNETHASGLICMIIPELDEAILNSSMHKHEPTFFPPKEHIMFFGWVLHMVEHTYYITVDHMQCHSCQLSSIWQKSQDFQPFLPVSCIKTQTSHYFRIFSKNTNGIFWTLCKAKIIACNFIIIQSKHHELFLRNTNIVLSLSVCFCLCFLLFFSLENCLSVVSQSQTGYTTRCICVKHMWNACETHVKFSHTKICEICVKCMWKNVWK